MNPTNCNGLTSGQSQPAKTYTHNNNVDFATGLEQSKAEANLRAQLALAGHAVHALKDGSYVVSKYGYTHHASDLEGLQAFAVRLGVCRFNSTTDSSKRAPVDSTRQGGIND
jgi:hypothetical protein